MQPVCNLAQRIAPGTTKTSQHLCLQTHFLIFLALNASEMRFWFTRLITALLKTPYLVQEPHPYFQPLGPHAACGPCLGRGGDAANLAS